MVEELAFVSPIRNFPHSQLALFVLVFLIHSMTRGNDLNLSMVKKIRKFQNV